MHYLSFRFHKGLGWVPKKLTSLLRSSSRLVLVLLLFSSLTIEALAQNSKRHSVRALQAAYLYHFTNFVTWPESTPGSSNFLICIDAPLGLTPEFTDLANKSVGDRPISVVRVTRETVLTDCEILLFNNTGQKRLNEHLSKVKNTPVLTVGTSKTFNQKGGIIQLDSNYGRVTLSVNLRPAKRVGLALSANMLDVAKEVIQ